MVKGSGMGVISSAMMRKTFFRMSDQFLAVGLMADFGSLASPYLLGSCRVFLKALKQYSIIFGS